MGGFMKNFLLLLVTLGASVSRGSGCDHLNVIETQGSLQAIQVDTDLGYLSHAEALNQIEIFRANYGHNIAAGLPQLPTKSNFRIRTQWATYKNLDTDCGWRIYQWNVAMKQLVIQISDDTVFFYPDLSFLRGEEIVNAPFLKITENKY